jgi:hypothetical protein
VKCFSCRESGPSAWIRNGKGPRRAIWCSRETNADVGATPDVAQWLRTRSVRVAWLINARRTVPGLTADAKEPA